MTVVIYHLFSSRRVKQKVLDLNDHPIILSIATLRGHGYTGDIIVIDKNPYNHDWEDLPQILNFSIKTIPRMQSNYFLERLSDIKLLMDESKENQIIFSDADIFWLSPLTIVPEQKIQFSLDHFGTRILSNSGFIIFEKNTDGEIFFKEWEKISKSVVQRSELYQIIQRIYGRPTDESVLNYMLNEMKMGDRVIHQEQVQILRKKCSKHANAVHMAGLAGVKDIVLSLVEFNTVLKSVIPERYFHRLNLRTANTDSIYDISFENFPTKYNKRRIKLL
jgi:hypothetical protein